MLDVGWSWDVKTRAAETLLSGGYFMVVNQRVQHSTGSCVWGTEENLTPLQLLW